MLPEGESIVWQGSPAWRPLARDVFKTRWVAAYFAVLVVGRIVMLALSGEDVSAAAESIATMLALFAGALGILTLVGWLHARSTLYTITTHRVVMRIGPALSMTWNLPFRRIVSADLRLSDDGTGDIVLRVDDKGPTRSWLLWPHIAPGHFFDPRPSLRSLPRAERVAEKLQAAVAKWGAEHAGSVQVGREDSVSAPLEAANTLVGQA
jgi:hypothetical protein